MFWRLVTVADDYGRFEADPRILLAQCFPLWVGGEMKLEEITEWWLELVEARLVRPYRIGEKQYGFFLTWDRHQRIRSRHSKFPPPPEGGDFESTGDARAIPTDLRQRILLRDRRCLACGSRDRLVVDHIRAVSAGGTSDEGNLQILCHPCNAVKQDTTLNFIAPGPSERAFAATRRRLRPLAATRRHLPQLAPEDLETRSEKRETRSENDNPSPAEPEAAWGKPEHLIELYNRLAPPGHPRVTRVTAGRRQKSRAYLEAFPERPFWVGVFSEIRLSSFLQGARASPGHESFRGDFDWLLTRGKDGTENAVKVHEGKYRDKEHA